ncbi:LLM class flavin-dependent oxidoreductase [Phyllobacterium myrsinacearum]|uniref:Alkanesulfonate monooxygenase SsuD/methylene tetrahydromethanopterin reductase-like flavin-dependent oxidoreductase (Luciferase family) n=1 Tax=Phyllobacterium myrsinacearum TaxID=28101 RepID=A0A839EG51_9HYPH|nr:LLM class flavin-dependent oxidoreductase [Phyllobacterium myrsinacearum]MBA8876446.1 alkanesulfonate monooxygenase SsuD/methylene tetrahydromethanopterin reductase-like flavin-dependent oxidoreductase (luciferase family) [Phyllobacterium myrsinacearum]
MHIGLSLTPFGHHPSAWRRKSGERAALDFGRMAAQVKKAEAGALDFVLLPDQFGQRPHDDLSPLAVPFEPTMLVSALATATSRIGLIAAAAMHQHEPYNLGRRFASLDLIGEGRTGWNVIGSDDPDRDQEYLDVVSGLWDSFEADAFTYDKARGRFFDPDKMHVLNHKGTHFTVRGPLNVNPSPQGRPVISHVLTPDTLDIAALADVVFLPGATPDALKALAASLVERLATRGRRREDVRFFANIIPSFGTSQSDVPHGFAVIGTASNIADQMQEQAAAAGLDGFVVLSPIEPEGVISFVDEVIPELRRRGVFRRAYDTTTLHGHLGLARPVRLERAS